MEETSLSLLERAQAGDAGALDELLARYRPRLARWASGRLPAGARALHDTEDLVQDTLVRTIRTLGAFKPEGEGALLAYLRQAIWNRVRDELRRVRVRPELQPLSEDLAGQAVSPLEQAIGRQELERYEAALAALAPARREAVIGRFEMGYSYPELARLLGKRTPDAARKVVEEAVRDLHQALSAPDGSRDR